MTHLSPTHAAAMSSTSAHADFPQRYRGNFLKQRADGLFPLHNTGDRLIMEISFSTP